LKIQYLKAKSLKFNDKQTIGNRLAHVINYLDFTLHVNMSDDLIRMSLKKSLNMCFFQNGLLSDTAVDHVNTTNDLPTEVML